MKPGGETSKPVPSVIGTSRDRVPYWSTVRALLCSHLVRRPCRCWAHHLVAKTEEVLSSARHVNHQELSLVGHLSRRVGIENEHVFDSIDLIEAKRH